MVKNFIIVILILLNLLTAYVAAKRYWPGITLVNYSYMISPGVRGMDYCFIDKRIMWNTDIAETVILIQDKTKHKKVVLHNWTTLLRSPF